MSKRFIDTEFFQDAFVAKLPKDYKILWLYMLLDCDHAGVWKANIPVVELLTGIKVNEKEAFELFDNKVIKLSNGDWFIPQFVKFQYGLPLNIGVKAVYSAYKILEEKGLSDLYETVGEPYCKGFVSLKDKDKDKNKDKDTKDYSNYFYECFENLKGQYPKPPKFAFVSLSRAISSGMTLDQWKNYVDNYFNSKWVSGHSLQHLLNNLDNFLGGNNGKRTNDKGYDGNGVIGERNQKRGNPNGVGQPKTGIF